MVAIPAGVFQPGFAANNPTHFVTLLVEQPAQSAMAPSVATAPGAAPAMGLQLAPLQLLQTPPALLEASAPPFIAGSACQQMPLSAGALGGALQLPLAAGSGPAPGREAAAAGRGGAQAFPLPVGRVAFRQNDFVAASSDGEATTCTSHTSASWPGPEAAVAARGVARRPSSNHSWDQGQGSEAVVEKAPAKKAAQRPVLLGQEGKASAAGEAKQQQTKHPQTKAQAGSQPLSGQVWRLARDAAGCRALQEALHAAPSNESRGVLAAELRGRVWPAMRHRHANHVLQKCIVTMRPSELQFIIDELCAKGSDGVGRAARHAYGCRILQRLLEHCRTDQLEGMVEGLLADAAALSKHVYGNFVIQHLMEYGMSAQRHGLVCELVKSTHELGRDIHSGAVVAKAMSYSCPEDQLLLARALIREEGAIATMARTRHGSLATKLVLQAVGGAEKDEAVRQIEEELPLLMARRYGRAVVASLRGPGGAAGSAEEAEASEEESGSGSP